MKNLRLARCGNNFGWAILYSCLVASLSRAQVPDQKGAYDVGFQRYTATSADGTMTVDSVVWYPTAPGTVGNDLIYTQRGFPYASPFIGGVLDAPPAAGSFPLIALSHGSGAWPVQFANLAESLASHGYVVTGPQHNTDDVNVRAQDLHLSVNELLNRSATSGQLFEGLINDDLIALGGYSQGAPSVGTATETADYDIDAIFLIDGVSTSWDIDVPVMHLGGGIGVYTTYNRLARGDYFGIDMGRLDPRPIHHWSFGMNGCQFRDKLVEAGATERQALGAVGTDSFWLGCNSDLIPLAEVQGRMNEYAINFFDHELKQMDVAPGIDATADQVLSTASDVTLLFTTYDTDSTSEGLAYVLTDPLGRKVGFDDTGIFQSDFETTEYRSLSLLRSYMTGLLRVAGLVPGEYTIDAIGKVAAERDYSIRIGSTIEHAGDQVYFQRVVSNGRVAPDQPLETIRFVVVPEPNSNLFAMVVGAAVLLTGRRRRRKC